MFMTERHYPLALKIAIVSLLAFDVVILFHNMCLGSIIFWFCLVFFFAILNSWMAAENDEFVYGDPFLLNDATCTALFFLILLELYNHTYNNILLYSSLIFILYYFWNKLLIARKYIEEVDLLNFQRSNVVAAVYSLSAWSIIQWIQISSLLIDLLNVAGIITWFLLLLVWYKETYTKERDTNSIM